MYRPDLIPTRHWPVDLALSASGEYVYLLNFHPPRRWWQPRGASISVLDTETGGETRLRRLRCRWPLALALDPAGTHLYATGARGRVSVIDLATRRRVARIRVGERPEALLADRGGDRLYVANASSGTVSVIATGTRTVVATIHSGTRPCALAAAGDRLYVANHLDRSVTVVDIERLTVVRTVPVGARPVALCPSPSGDRLYVATSRPAAIRVLRADSLQPIATFPLTTRFPRPPILSTDPPAELEARAVAVSHDGRHLVVALHEPGSLLVVDTARERVVDEYDLGRDRLDGPTRLVADPRSGRFYAVCVGPNLTVLG